MNKLCRLCKEEKPPKVITRDGKKYFCEDCHEEIKKAVKSVAKEALTEFLANKFGKKEEI